ncbi:hypothetical protein MATL_G00124600 [Megalops atlanticus]|uniref:Uncharacterized protein n=1 Tax=Megalops atlanticus TaxID=7932 RepID=A0A9D3TBB4_MEGAT|nr:hypothetical protein MATL_G00124600 [Megalops atlanticus]
MEWRVSGLRVTNSTDRVIREEQLGSAGLRSSLTMRHSQGDTPTLLCLSTNTLGSSGLQLHLPSPDTPSVLSSTGFLLIGVLLGASVTGLLCGLTLKQPREPLRDSGKHADQVQSNDDTAAVTDLTQVDTEHLSLTERSPAKEEEPIYANCSMVTERKEEEEEGKVHSGSDVQTQIQTEIQNQADGDTGQVKDIPKDAGEEGNSLYACVATIRKTKKVKKEQQEQGVSLDSYLAEERCILGDSGRRAQILEMGGMDSLYEEMSERKKKESKGECVYADVVFKSKDTQS